MRSLCIFPSFCHDCWAISYLLTLLSTLKATIRANKALNQMLLPTLSTYRSFKRRTTSIPSLRFRVRHPIIVVHWGILVVEPFFGPWLTLFIGPSSFCLPIHSLKFRLFNSLRIYHEPWNIHVMMKHLCTALFFNHTRHSHGPLWLEFRPLWLEFGPPWIELSFALKP